MAAKEIGSDMNYAWPTAQIAVMVEIISAPTSATRKRSPHALKSIKTAFYHPLSPPSAAISTTSSCPHSTRRRIARALAMLRDKHVEMPMKKHDNLPL
jgi:propionyl-CoA carboxylase beta chain